MSLIKWIVKGTSLLIGTNESGILSSIKIEYRKATLFFYVCEKFMRICQNGPLDKFMQFLYMRSSNFCIVMYGAIKIYAVQIYATSA